MLELYSVTSQSAFYKQLVIKSLTGLMEPFWDKISHIFFLLLFFNSNLWVETESFLGDSGEKPV